MYQSLNDNTNYWYQNIIRYVRWLVITFDMVKTFQSHKNLIILPIPHGNENWEFYGNVIFLKMLHSHESFF